MPGGCVPAVQQAPAHRPVPDAHLAPLPIVRHADTDHFDETAGAGYFLNLFFSQAV